MIQSMTAEIVGTCGGALHVRIDYEFYPAERRVLYYPDGSGYPGCPADAAVLSVRAERYVDSDGRRTDRRERPDWFAWADSLAADYFAEREDATRNAMVSDAERYIYH